MEARWKNGRVDGKVYQLWEEHYDYCEFEEGLEHGKQMTYDLQGTCIMNENSHGFQHGKFRFHEPDGTLTKGEYQYGEVQGVLKAYGADGTRKEGHIRRWNRYRYCV